MLLYMRAAVYGCCYIGLLLYRAAAVYGCCCCYIWLLLCNNALCLCRVPGQERCFDATVAEGCIGFCCFPCSILGATVEPEFLMYTVAASSRVLGAWSTITVSVVASAPVCVCVCIYIYIYI